jgi:hypothetical protein
MPHPMQNPLLCLSAALLGSLAAAPAWSAGGAAQPNQPVSRALPYGTGYESRLRLDPGLSASVSLSVPASPTVSGTATRSDGVGGNGSSGRGGGKGNGGGRGR